MSVWQGRESCATLFNCRDCVILDGVKIIGTMISDLNHADYSAVLSNRDSVLQNALQCTLTELGCRSTHLKPTLYRSVLSPLKTPGDGNGLYTGKC